MKLYSKNEIGCIPWHTSKVGLEVKPYLEPLLQKGSAKMISNIDSELFILHIDDLFIPVTKNKTEYFNSYVCSIYAYLLYAEEEMHRHQGALVRLMLTPLLAVCKIWFKLSKINQLISVNNFFLSTNLYYAISKEQIASITDYLQELFPNHAILLRSLNERTESNLCQSLKRKGYDLITSRSVYFFDPNHYSKLHSKKRWIAKSDYSLLDQPDINVISHQDFVLCDAIRIQELYDQLYLEKYSQYNPAFTIQFFEEAIQNETFSLSGILYRGSLVGIIGYFMRNKVMVTPIVGYDTSLPKELGLYRMLTALMIQKSRETGHLFHMSAGVGHFKRQRGAAQEIESMAVYTKHLQRHRRCTWKILAFLFNRIAKPLLLKLKL